MNIAVFHFLNHICRGDVARAIMKCNAQGGLVQQLTRCKLAKKKPHAFAGAGAFEGRANASELFATKCIVYIHVAECKINSQAFAAKAVGK